jgi:F-box protein 9
MGSSNQEHELEAFRQEWRKEVQDKQGPASGIPSTSSSTTTDKKPDTDSLAPQQHTADKDFEEQEEEEEEVNVDPVSKSAMDHYVNAVENEREGKLGKGNIEETNDTQCIIHIHKK